MVFLGPNGQPLDEEERDRALAEARQAVGGADDGNEFAPSADGPAGAAPPTHLTGFWVVVDFDGNAMASNDLAMDYRFARSAGVGDMFSACSQVVKDISSMEVAQRTVMLMAQQAQQAQAQIEAARAAQAVLADPTGARLRRS